MISQYTIYPEIDYQTRTEGIVLLASTINRLGQVSDIQVSRSVTNTLNEAAIKSLNLVPHFEPGTQNWHAINVRFHVPITFKIDKNY